MEDIEEAASSIMARTADINRWVMRAGFKGGLSPDMVGDMKRAAEHIGKFADQLARKNGALS